MKPGPATSTEAIRSSARSFAAIFSARSRGLAFASLASTIAALVAMSPWVASRGGSTTTRDKSMPDGQTPSAASAAQTACTRASTSAKRCTEEDLSAMGRRLTQIRGRVKKPLMFGQREAVGHSGDEVADPPRTLDFGVPATLREPFGRQIARHLLIAREQVEQDLFGLAHHPHHPRMPVHPLLQERLDAGLGLRDACRKRDQDVTVVADIVDRSRLRGIETPARLRDNSSDQI